MQNRTINLLEEEKEKYLQQIIQQYPEKPYTYPVEGVMLGENWHKFLPNEFVDMLFLDPPYNLYKKFSEDYTFKKQTVEEYTEYLKIVITNYYHTLKPNATIYICGDWLTSASIFKVAQDFFKVQNRITWEREKGRGAKKNYKNGHEDIWFCTMDNNYTFNVDSIKLRKKVNAPYVDKEGKPKDWINEKDGNFRDTYPSNFWTDITVPFWSMPENTSHPTQKSEKLLAKLILASTNEKDFILDPFVGSGTTLAVSKKLNRKSLGIEIDEYYACCAMKRLEIAENNKNIQGYESGIFWERNSQPKGK